MINTIYWIERQAELLDKNKIEEASECGETIKQENHDGIEMCMMVVLQSQIRGGLYTCVPTTTQLQREVTRYATRPNVSVSVDDSFPPWVLVDRVLFKIIFKNSFDNAQTHGLKDGAMAIHLTVSDQNIVLSITNEPGAKHANNVSLQKAKGDNCLLIDCESNIQYGAQIGSKASTFLGLGEVRVAAKAMGAKVALNFLPDSVVFTLTMDLLLSEEPDAVDENALPKGTIFVCADDDKIPRLKYNSLLKDSQLNADREKSLILGETFDEVKDLAQTVMDLASKFGESKIVCIFDQNMDRYADQGQGFVLGTEVTAELRDMGFKAPIFICSANDDLQSMDLYRKAGASGTLSKYLPVPEVATDLVSQCNSFYRNRNQYYNNQY